MSRIAETRYRQLHLDLTQPYVLAMTTVRRIHVHLVELRTEDGRTAAGEAVPLHGYTEETDADLAAAIPPPLEALRGADLSVAAARIDQVLDHHRYPLAASAIHTALQLLQGFGDWPTSVQVPLLAAVSTGDDHVLNKAEAHLQRGFKTIKVKVGRDIAQDIRDSRRLLDAVGERCRLRFDANQGYNEADAQALIDCLTDAPAGAVELLEQPLPTDRWDGFARLTAGSPVPLMLDESIFTADNVRRAADVGAALIKLKLLKHRGPTEVVELAELARQLGMGVVIGNGVASDLSNLIEAGLYAGHPGLFTGASESNGFARLTGSLLRNAPTVRNGDLVWQRSDADPWALTQDAARGI